MSRFRLLGAEAIRSIGANLSTTIAATMTVLIGMFLLGLFIALGTWVLAWSGHVKRELTVKVFFDDKAGAKQIDDVRVRLQANGLVKTVNFVSKEDALKKMKKSHPELVRNLAYNPFPASYEVQPLKGEYTEKISGTLYPLPAGVAKICPPPAGVKLAYSADDCGRRVTHRVLQVAKITEAVFFVAVVVLLVSSMLLIANTIRLSIFARRREIEVMKLVGATNWFVRGPFMLEGLIVGLLGALAAIVLLVLGKELALPSIVGHVGSSSDVHAMPFALIALIILGMGVVLGAAGSGLTIRRFLQV
jgi:cell division transport system permease protein